MKEQKINYLSNKRLLNEILKSKLTYSYFMDPTKTQYDIVVDDLDNIPELTLTTALKRYTKTYNKINNTKHLYNHFSITDLVVRLMTYEHITKDINWPINKEKKLPKDGYIRLNFPPFQQFIYINNKPVLVGLSHNKNGVMETEHGHTTNELGHMYIMLVERIGRKPNFSGYTYINDMKAQAIVRLCEVGLNFKEGSQQHDNPFAYYTRIVYNTFYAVLNDERKHRDIRDDLLEDAGQTPSLTRQMLNFDK